MRIRLYPSNLRKISSHDRVFSEIVIAGDAQLNRHLLEGQVIMEVPEKIDHEFFYFL